MHLHKVQGDDHQRPVFSILEVPVPSGLELRPQRSNLGLSRPELARCVHRIPPQKRVLLVNHLREVEASVGKAVDGLIGAETGAITPQREMVVLVVITHTGKVLHDRHTGALQNVLAPNSRPLQDQWAAIGARRQHDELPRAHGLDAAAGLVVLGVRLVLDAHGALGVIEQDADGLVLHQHVEVGIVAALELGVDVAMSGVLAATVGPDVAEPALDAVVGIEVLQVLEFRIADCGGGVDEVVFGLLGSEGAAGDVDGPVGAVVLGVATAVIRLKLKGDQRLQDSFEVGCCKYIEVQGVTYLLQKRPQLIRRPPRRVPRVEVGPLRPRIHHPVDGRPTAQNAARGHNGAPVGQLRRLVALPEQRRRAAFFQVLREEGRVDHLRHLIVVAALLEEQDGQAWVRLR